MTGPLCASEIKWKILYYLKGLLVHFYVVDGYPPAILRLAQSRISDTVSRDFARFSAVDVLTKKYRPWIRPWGGKSEGPEYGRESEKRESERSSNDAGLRKGDSRGATGRTTGRSSSSTARTRFGSRSSTSYAGRE